MNDGDFAHGDIDLTNCDREPIHQPGAILPHGALLVLDNRTFEVLQAAGDTESLLGVAMPDLLGRNAEILFQPSQIDRLREICADGELSRPRHLLDPALRVDARRPLDASIHRSHGDIVLEFEAADTLDPHAADPLACVQDMLEGLESAPSLQAFCQQAAERVRKVAGYDRVMVYRFMADETGWVIAESREPHLVPFLDLHYPASDIPKQARALYLRNALRLIAQVDYEPAPLKPLCNPRTGRQLDMSQATLRNVSPIHREYLRNMGVDASMSISIVREGKLWGLIACHHYSPRPLPRHLRAVCEIFGSIFSLQLEVRERAELFEARLASRQVLQQLMQGLASEDDYAAGLIRQSSNLLDYIDADGISLRTTSRGGVSLRVNNGITSLGNTPNDDQVAALTDWLSERMGDGEGIFTTDRLGELWPRAREFADVGAGVLAVSVSRTPRDFVIWFRPEVVQTVSWGGDPSKPIEPGPHGDRLTPRKSFAAWQEIVRGRSSPWLVSEYDAAFDLRVSLLEVVLRRIDAAARERARAYEHERLLMAELDHRVKNTLANIQAMIIQSSRSAESLTDFSQGLDRRIRSMAKAHSLLTESRWEGVLIGALIHDELDAYGQGGALLDLSGPRIVLTPKAALALSLAMHELATNAAKYGALSQQAGSVAVQWQTTLDGGLKLSWKEHGGPTVTLPTRRGFGSLLIGRALAMETGGHTELVYHPSGVSCEIILPRQSVVRELPDGLATPESPPPPEHAARTCADRAYRVLVVEDSSLVAMTLEHMLDQLGWQMIGPATRLAEAIELATTQNIDAALLDVNLDGEMSWQVAYLLKQRAIPFAFTTGYGGATVLPPELADSIIVGKPFRVEDVERRLREMFAARSAG